MESLEVKQETFTQKKERLEGSISFLKESRFLWLLASSAGGVGTLMSVYSALTKQPAGSVDVVKILAAAAAIIGYLKAKKLNDKTIEMDTEYTTLTKYPGNCTQKREDTKFELERVNKNKNIGIGISIAALVLAISGIIIDQFVSGRVPYDGYVELISKDVIATILYCVGDIALVIGTVMARLNGLEQKVLKKRQRYLQ